MTKKITCIECPKSCLLTVEIESCRLVKVEDNECPKGEVYAKTEIENPLRILTGTVVARGLSLKMVPVRTDKPIPKAKILKAAAELKKIRVTAAYCAGDIMVPNFLSLGVNLIATRDF